MTRPTTTTMLASIATATTSLLEVVWKLANRGQLLVGFLEFVGSLLGLRLSGGQIGLNLIDSLL